MHISARFFAMLAAPLCLASHANAEGTWTVGAFALGETGYYVGHDDGADLLPYVVFENDRFEFSLTNGITYHALGGDRPDGSQTQLSFVLAPRWAPGFSKDPIFSGLKRDTAVEAGLRGTFETGLFFGEAEALADISGTHKGFEASAVVGLQYEAGAFSLKGGAGARYRSDDLNQYLFGVSTAEATPLRNAFAPGDTTTGFASITAVYSLNDNMALVGDLTFEDLGKLDRSPLVDKDSNTSLTLGLLYQF